MSKLPIHGDWVSSDFARQLERELAEAKAWKEQAMVVFNSLDLQSTAALLGGGIGEDCAEVIAKRVPEVVGQLLAHEAQHVRDEADYNELEADYRGSIAKHVERVEKLEAIIDAHKAMLQKACAELPVSYYPDNTPEKLPENIAGFVKDYTENYGGMENALTYLTAITAGHFYQSSCRGGEMERLMNQAIESLSSKP